MAHRGGCGAIGATYASTESRRAGQLMVLVDPAAALKNNGRSPRVARLLCLSMARSRPLRTHPILAALARELDDI